MPVVLNSVGDIRFDEILNCTSTLKGYYVISVPSKYSNIQNRIISILIQK